jgi:hypothetical protein
VVLVVGEKGTLWDKLPGYLTVESSLGLAGHGNRPVLLSMDTRDLECSLQTGDNNKRGCCTGRHAAWPMKWRIQSSGVTAKAQEIEIEKQNSAGQICQKKRYQRRIGEV